MYSKLKALVKNNINLITNFFSLLALKGVDFLIPLFILPYLVRTLGLDVFGLISYSLAFCMYFGAVIHYGYSITAVRDIARVRENIDHLSRSYSEFLIASLLLMIFSFCIFILIISLIPSMNDDWWLHLYTFYFVAMQSFFPSWFFQGVEKMKYIAIINLATKILFLISLITLVKNPEDYLLVPLLNGCSMMASTIISLLIIRTHFKVKYCQPSYLSIKNIIVNGRHSFIALFAPTLYNSTSMFLLGHVSSNRMVGIYASATKLIDAMTSLAILFSTTFLPFLSRNIKKHLFFSKIMLYVGSVLTFFAFVFSDQLILMLFSKEKLIVSWYFKLLTPMVLFIFVRLTYGPNYLMLINKESVYKKIMLTSCLIFFLIALYLVPKYEIYGAVFILNCTSLVMAIFTVIAFKKYRLKNY